MDKQRSFDADLAALTSVTEVAQRMMSLISELREERDAEVVRLRALGCPASDLARACRISERQITKVIQKAIPA